ncbi:hypothetical protein D932_02096, partial [Enterococcus casseliflavus 14-MB-W-14]
IVLETTKKTDIHGDKMSVYHYYIKLYLLTYHYYFHSLKNDGF